MALSRKAINYDLDDKLLQQHYPNPKNYKNAWRDVKSYLYKNGFEDRQYSGVISTSPMRINKVLAILDSMNNTLDNLDFNDIKNIISNDSKEFIGTLNISTKNKERTKEK